MCVRRRAVASVAVAVWEEVPALDTSPRTEDDSTTWTPWASQRGFYCREGVLTPSESPAQTAHACTCGNRAKTTRCSHVALSHHPCFLPSLSLADY